MKKNFLIFLIVSIFFIFTVLPIGFLTASSNNLITNGDFEVGNLNGWGIENSEIYNDNGNWVAKVGPPTIYASVYQEIGISEKNLYFSCRFKPDVFNNGYIQIGMDLLEGTVRVGMVFNLFYPKDTPTGKWITFNRYLPDWYLDHNGKDLPDFEKIDLGGTLNGEGIIAYFDDFYLSTEKLSKDAKNNSTEPEIELYPEPEPKPWIRGDRDMTCYQVLVNDNGCFEFVFIYEYKNNNWVKIYDEDDAEVFSINMPYGKASFEACLSDGTYTVKTFHDDMSEPLQEFTISKP
jgi:hypothetical protein